MQQKYVLTELDSGERVISERLAHVRSVAIGFWIGAGSRDETDAKAGISHFIEHLLFKGTASYSAQEIAEIFDGLGGELNAATSREHTVVYARIPDDKLEVALDVMGEMVFAPAFAELDAEREVVLEEIAMYEDQPQELVHDLISEATFGTHPLGRPVIGRAEVISSVTPPRDLGLPPLDVRARQHRRRRRREPEARGVRAAAGASAATRERRRPKGPKVRPALVKPPPPSLRFQRKDTEQYHVCIARARDRPLRPAPLRRLAARRRSSAARPRRGSSRRSARSAAWPTPSTASPRSTPTPARSASTSARARTTSRPASRSRASRSPTSPAATCGPSELERAKENLKGRIMLSMESTSNRMSRLGKSLITDTELLSIERIMAEIDAVEPDALAELADVLLAPEKLSAAGIGPSEERFLEAVERVNPGARARRVKVVALRPRRQGRLGARAGAGGAGHELVELERGRGDGRLHGAGRGRGERARRARAGRAVRRRHERLGSGAARRAGAPSAASPLLVVPNFALGAVLMMRLAAEAARHLPRAEIVELHGEGKKDAPSGTAKATAERARRRAADPLGPAARASSRIRRCSSAATGSC